MEWSASSATNAYLDTLKLCNSEKTRMSRSDSKNIQEPGSNEFVSALAAGMNAKLIVEVTHAGVSPSTLALAAAARHTGGKLVCIHPNPQTSDHESNKKLLEDSGLQETVEFKTGDPFELLRSYEKIDFSLVDCKNEEYQKLLEMVDVNPKRSMVVASNLGERRWGGLGINCKDVAVRSMKNPIGKGMEINVIGRSNCYLKAQRRCEARKMMKVRSGNKNLNNYKSQWVVKVDEKTGEEHIFRLPRCS